jgi:hypothetical protein
MLRRPSVRGTAAGMCRSVRSVSTVDGATQLARTPCGPYWAATSRVSITTPAFAALYGAGAPVAASRPASDDIVTIEPRPRSTMPGRNAFRLRNVAVRLPSTVECQSSMLVSCSRPGRARPSPTKAISTSTGPSSASAHRAGVFDRRVVGAVGDHAVRLRAVEAQLGHHLVERAAVAAGHQHARAVVGAAPAPSPRRCRASRR